MTSISKAKSMGALGTVNIHVIGASHDGSGASGSQILETWTLNQAWVKEFKPSAMDYDGDNLSTIDITFKYDWATLNSGVGGDGVSVSTPYWSTSTG